MSILFASNNWRKYQEHFKNAFAQNNLMFEEIVTDLETNNSDIEFIIYEPNSGLKDFSRFENCKAILSLWAGVEDLITNKTLKQPLIRLVDAGMKQGMVEWCLAHVLRHHLGTDIHVKNQDGVWRSNFIPPLANEVTIGVLGLGWLGSAVAEALSNLGFNVNGWSESEKTITNVNSYFKLENLSKVLQSAQILITLLPLTPKTKYILGSETLKMLPKNCIILNPGRGHLIDDRALISALDSGHIRYATLDVFSQEPLKASHEYWSHPSVTVTPHIAAHTRPKSSANTITQSILKIRRGQIPIGLVNKEKMY